MLNAESFTSELQWFGQKTKTLEKGSNGSAEYVSAEEFALRDEDFSWLPHILVGMPNRDPQLLQRLCQLANARSQISFTAILGDWWQGATRATPFPSPLQSLYWYEQYKLPALLGLARKASTEPCISPSVLLISQTPEHCRSFCNAAESLGWTAMATDWTGQLPHASVRKVLLDLPETGRVDASSESAQKRSANDVIAKLQAVYPNAESTVLTDFPRWNIVSPLLNAGVANVCAKPYDLAALLR